jgi:hypothetical protein
MIIGADPLPAACVLFPAAGGLIMARSIESRLAAVMRGASDGVMRPAHCLFAVWLCSAFP